jgi:hypothetical protein
LENPYGESFFPWLNFDWHPLLFPYKG